MKNNLVCFVLVAIVASSVGKSNNRIVGGDYVAIEDFPYQVSLQYIDEHKCGGSIIGPKHILTASHCTNGYTTSAFTVRIGTDINNEGGEIIKIDSIDQHPKFDAATYDYDVAVITLKEAIHFGSNKASIQLTTAEIDEGEMAIVSGWGYTKEGGSYSEKLKAVNLPLVKRGTCQEAYKKDNITERMICAGFLGIGGEDACQGDSGGPLVYNGQQIGIVSWGEGCARPEYPGIFANVADLRSFINEISGI